MLVTSVEVVLLDYGTPKRRPCSRMPMEDAEAHLAEGHPGGEHGPQGPRASCRFLRNGGGATSPSSPPRRWSMPPWRERCASSKASRYEDHAGAPGERGIRRAGIVGVVVLKDRYVDSVVQMSASRDNVDTDGVAWAAAAMGTPANLDTLAGRGFDTGAIDATANDCFLAVDAEHDGALDAKPARWRSAEEGAAAARRRQGKVGLPAVDGRGARRPRCAGFGGAGEAREPRHGLRAGQFCATLEAHKALSAGLHVLLFSDDVQCRRSN